MLHFMHMDLLGVFFPKRCVGCRRSGGYICADCFAKLDMSVSPICAVCSRLAISGITHPACRRRYTIDGVFSSLVYKGLTKRLIYQFKFAPYLSDLSSLLGELFYEGLIQQEAFIVAQKGNTLLVPIPLHPSRYRKRGYNQALLLAEDLGKRLGVPVRTVLTREKLTKTQVGLTQEQRRENIKGAFVFKTKGEDLTDTTVFLVDDILTSGATLAEAAKILKKAGVKNVWGITLAHGS